MFFYEGMSCPVCKQAFRENEDIVSCPQCGAPHHRDCWKKEGHCHFAAQHGTAEQWSRSAESASAEKRSGVKRCPQCGAENSEFAEFCSHCTCPLETEDWAQRPSPDDSAPPPPYTQTPPYREYSPFYVATADPFGGVPKTEQIDGETVEDVAMAIGNNTGYYVPRFFRMARGGSKVSWNWAAFFLTPYWLLYRKSYLFGMLTLVYQMFYAFLSGYVSFALLGGVAVNAASVQVLETRIQSLLQSSSASWLWLLGGLWLVDLLIRLVFGLLGNYLYMNTCIGRVRRLRDRAPESYKVQLPAAGGVSFLLGLIGYFAVEMMTIITQALLM